MRSMRRRRLEDVTRVGQTLLSVRHRQECLCYISVVARGSNAKKDEELQSLTGVVITPRGAVGDEGAVSAV